MSELLQAIQREKNIALLLNKCVIPRKLGRVVQIKAVYIFVETA